MTANRCLVLHPADDVATALADLATGEAVAAGVTAVATIPFGHKVALRDIAAGETVKKYGEVIGVASAAIAAGEHVSVHNLASGRARGDAS